MQSRVARGCGVAYGLRRCHIGSSVHGTCKRMHMNILRSPIGSWFWLVGRDGSPPIAPTARRGRAATAFAVRRHRDFDHWLRVQVRLLREDELRGCVIVAGLRECLESTCS